VSHDIFSQLSHGSAAPHSKCGGNYTIFWHREFRAEFNRWLITRENIATARISYGNSGHPSVCSSVTTRYQFKTRWDRKFGFSPYDSPESIVFRDNISWRWVKGIPTNKGAKEKHPLKNVILPLLARRRWKWLQIDTDMLLITTRTGDEILRNVNIDDL